MFRNTSLRELMYQELPPLGYQKRLCYRTDREEVVALWRLLNKEIFNGKLEMPLIEVMPRCRTYWGICFGSYTKIHGTKSKCKIRLMDKWFCRQWLITTLAHEMCHQYQWDVIGESRLKEGKEPLMSHGPSFFVYRNKLAKHGISLKRSHGMRRWFKHQRFDKC
jgi:hypothetical protein